MSEILANIVVEQTEIAFQPEVNNINVTPEAINLNIFTAGAPGAGQSSNGELLFNNVNLIDGVPNTSVANGTLIFTNLANLKIAGGTNSYYLQTDGTGNLSWAVGAGNVSGNGVPGGSNTQIQYNDGGGTSFGGSAGFTFDKSSNVFSAPGNANIAGKLTSVDANLGNAATANYFIGTLYGTANTAITANTVTDNAQPNITSVGTLIGLTVGGTATAAALRTTETKIALGLDAAGSTPAQSVGAIAIGTSAGFSNQGPNSIAIGYAAGYLNAGDDSISIGRFAGHGPLNQQADNSIVINATGANLQSNVANTFTVKPIRNANAANILFYDQSSGEITYDNSANLTINTANYAAYAGNIVTAAQPNITSVGNLTSLTIQGTTTVQQIKEKVTPNSTGSTGTINFDLLTSAIINKTANATADWTINFRGNSTTTLDTMLNSNESITCTFINQNGVNVYVPSNITIDSANTTVVWTGNTGGPGTGTQNGKDMYTFNIIKSTANTYVVFSSRTGYI